MPLSAIKFKHTGVKYIMNKAYIDSILRVVLESNMAELNIRSVSLRPITCSIEDGKEVHTVEIHLSDVIGFSRAKLSEAWVASNLLLFTVFDGYLENQYSLTEGVSFKNHYLQLPSNDDIEKIQKDCYRIMKLLRNAAQHNLSGIQYNEGSYVVSYGFRGTDYRLKISKRGMDCLYTILINIMHQKISGLCKQFLTKGHFNGIIRKLYEEMCSEIECMEDDIGVWSAVIISGLKLEYAVRYPVINPLIIEENEKRIFKHIANKAGVNKTGETVYYPTDYVYKNYIFPQEIGKIVSSNSVGKAYDVIEFEKSNLCSLWEKME